MLCRVAVALVAAGVAAAATAGDAREVVNFDFSWRHHLGNVTAPPHANCTNGTEGVNYGTGGRSHSNVGTPAMCCGLCAEDPTCQCWDWNSDQSSKDYKACWTKNTDCDTKVSATRFSGVLPPAPPGPAVPKEATTKFDDSKWELVDTPHDMLIEQPYDPSASEKQAFLPRNIGWYRKHFHLPKDWEGSSVWLYIEGSFHVTTIWLNGIEVKHHIQGYTSFSVRLDNVPGAIFSDTDENVLAVYVDASFGTGWWYEGGGLMRHQTLVRANPTHLNPTGGAWVHADNITNAGAATFVAHAEVDNDGNEDQSVVVQATVRDSRDGTVVASGQSGQAVTVPANSTRFEMPDVRMPVKAGVKAWSVYSPNLYDVEISIAKAAAANGADSTTTTTVIDAVNVTSGVRTIRWDADEGLYLNAERVKLRGFCDHTNFGGVGGALGDRINLFRAQTLRAVGGNSWRMAHNPPCPTRLDFMDRLGMLAIDENRDYGGNQGQGGTTFETVADELVDMADLVRRDRSHPSVMIWSFCNEVGCKNETSAQAFREVSKHWDPTRAVTQNHYGSYNISGMYLDVQGFSHKNLGVFQEFHKDYPTVPLMATECCSCMSQRGVDQDECPKPKDGGCEDPPEKLPDGTFYNNNIGICTSEQVLYSDAPDYVTGTFVWSGFDYLGEARGWPQNTKCRGTVADVAGFTKETAYWLRSWWFSNITQDDKGKPANPPAVANAAGGTPSSSEGANDNHTLFILEGWNYAGPKKSRTVNVYTDAPQVELQINGKSVGTQSVPFFGMATFNDVAYQPGKLTAISQDSSGTEIARYTVETTGQVVGVVVTIDAPSKLTGTGSYVVADGEDVALIRATLVDAAGLIVPDAANNVTFSVLSGPGRVLATHSGSPADTSPSHAAWTPAYHGLARAFIRTTEDSATPLSHRRRIQQIDAEANPNVQLIVPESEDADSVYSPSPIVVVATATLANGTTVSGQVSVQVSDDLRWSPREVASRSVFGEE